MATSTPERGPLTGYYIWRLALKWRAEVDRVLAPLDLTQAEYSLLASLAGLSRAGRKPSQRELSDFSGLEPMYVSKLARALEQDGLLERETNSADPRAFRLTLSEHGAAILDAAYSRVHQLQDRLLSPLGNWDDPRRTEFKQILETLLRHAEDLDAPVVVAATTQET
jgi:MarR family transcriptional regulator, organic hydroperoxide resistance regulator